MEQSLVEAEAEKQKEKQCISRAVELRYKQSVILQELRQEANTGLPSSWEHHQKSLLDLLGLELKVCSTGDTSTIG